MLEDASTVLPTGLVSEVARLLGQPVEGVTRQMHADRQKLPVSEWRAKKLNEDAFSASA